LLERLLCWNRSVDYILHLSAEYAGPYVMQVFQTAQTAYKCKQSAQSNQYDSPDRPNTVVVRDSTTASGKISDGASVESHASVKAATAVKQNSLLDIIYSDRAYVLHNVIRRLASSSSSSAASSSSSSSSPSSSTCEPSQTQVSGHFRLLHILCTFTYISTVSGARLRAG
jgi:hypothetical protein